MILGGGKRKHHVLGSRVVLPYRSVLMKYACTECQWSVGDGSEHAAIDSSELAIEHYVQSGHSVKQMGDGPPSSQIPIRSTRL